MAHGCVVWLCLYFHMCSVQVNLQEAIYIFFSLNLALKVSAREHFVFSKSRCAHFSWNWALGSQDSGQLSLSLHSPSLLIRYWQSVFRNAVSFLHISVYLSSPKSPHYHPGQTGLTGRTPWSPQHCVAQADRCDSLCAVGAETGKSHQLLETGVPDMTCARTNCWEQNIRPTNL